VSVFLSARFVITVRQGVASELHGVRMLLERRPDLLAHGSSAVLWAILDRIVDDYAPVVEGLEQDVDEVEDTVFGGSPAATERIYRLRSVATDFYRAVHPLLGPLDSLQRGAFPQIAEDLLPFLRDVDDHLKLVNEELVGQRESLAVVLQANMAVISLEQNEISVRQNAAMKQLTVISTIFLPLTFVTGFFGMNFGWMVGRITSFPVFALLGVGSMVISCVGVWAWFRRTGVLVSEDGSPRVGERVS
jgi:magnesium transporter